MSKIEMKRLFPPEIEPEIVILTDEQVVGEVRRYLEMHGYKRIIEIVRDVRKLMYQKGYVVSEDRVRKILRELMGLEYYKYNY